MFNWIAKTQKTEKSPTARKTVRTLVTERGTKFDVFAETQHFAMCSAPENSADTPAQALLDFEELSERGYWLCHIYHGLGGFVVFEKRGPNSQ